jgi:flagellar hook-basal body complex protein FliE
MNDISILSGTELPRGVAPAPKRAPLSESNSFSQMLKDSLDQVSRLQQESSESIQNLITGKQTNIHQTMIANEKSGEAFELVMQVRNKSIDAYEKIMGMAI